ncbi:hypothetical protein CEXT_633821 [Caerostris extrusa]|uniref:Uncharacterized protein n=1 Tax=Caerostris extrusa TaxID=172846 RepID=A0AAV4UNI3_CAEEX|nr:hypothetical protein CEXT_633821 [Caerostris extrusa]
MPLIQTKLVTTNIHNLPIHTPFQVLHRLLFRGNFFPQQSGLDRKASQKQKVALLFFGKMIKGTQLDAVTNGVPLTTGVIDTGWKQQG